MTGLSIAATVIVTLILVILALVLVKHFKPKSAVGKAVQQAEDEFVPGIKSVALEVEIGLDNELMTLLDKAEHMLMNTSGEDAAIAAAQERLARVAAEAEVDIAAANAKKTAKLAALQAHVATLTASGS